ncbi:MAG: DUF1049 domain-containing protein [Actinobacteria bacterium]|nr:DUF1049 domain-containing protein [Actinomycetota bacterium]
MEHPRKVDRQQWQPWLWFVLVGLLLAVAYLIAFVVENSHSVAVHWVFGTTHGSLIWVILVSLALGLLVGVLLSQLYRRRQRSHTPEQLPESLGDQADTVGDLGGDGEAERETS